MPRSFAAVADIAANANRRVKSPTFFARRFGDYRKAFFNQLERRDTNQKQVSRMETSSSQPPPQAERLGSDLLIGASDIGRELGLSESAVYYLHRKKLLPIGKLGKLLIASRRKLRRAAQSLTSE
jgi:hypothetical protein